ncbi:MAG: STAS/SEC14 domain-containing protein [Armatimonadetes bacterium]|nr:STAS/SEC14 domain-containing protein [Armatimonadota bacterium]
MPTVQLEAQLSPEQLLNAVEQLNVADLDILLDRILTLRAERRLLPSSQAEASLLKATHWPLTPDEQRRYEHLIARRQAEVITPEELQELIGTTDRLEAWNVERLNAVIALAKLRHVSTDEMLRTLGI